MEELLAAVLARVAYLLIEALVTRVVRAFAPVAA